MEVQIIEFIPEEKGYRKGFLDIRVIYTPEKSETFRAVTLIQKDNKTWLTFPNVKRGDQWLPYYERTPEISKQILKEALIAFNNRNKQQPKQNIEKDEEYYFA
jgi:hypothetical protein